MTKKQVSTVVAPVVEEVKTVKIGIGSTIIEMILKNPELSNKEILEKVLAKFETAKTSYACIAWYKSDLRKKGLIGPRVFATKDKTDSQMIEVQ
jgi:hypothetical protein